MGEIGVESVINNQKVEIQAIPKELMGTSQLSPSSGPSLNWVLVEKLVRPNKTAADALLMETINQEAGRVRLDRSCSHDDAVRLRCWVPRRTTGTPSWPPWNLSSHGGLPMGSLEENDIFSSLPNTKTNHDPGLKHSHGLCNAMNCSAGAVRQRCLSCWILL